MNYTYGYQGSEKDDEITGSPGSSYTTHFRQLDTRLGRWWGIDPKTLATPWESPYMSMSGNPIWFNDPLGDIVKVKGLAAKIAVGVGRLTNKEFRQDFKAKKIDTETTFTFNLKSGSPSLFNAQEVPLDASMDASEFFDVDFSLFGPNAPSFPEIERKTEIVRKTVFKDLPEGGQTITNSVLLRKRVPGQPVTVDAETIPDLITITNETTGRILFGPTLLGSPTTFAGVANRTATLAAPGAGRIRVNAQATGQNVMLGGRTIRQTNSRFSVTYTQFSGFRIVF